MDLELPELLKQTCPADGHPLRGVFQRLLSSADRIPGLATEGWSPGDRLAARLLWLSSHYLSAAATSHGLQLAYVEGNAENGRLTPQFGTIARDLPSKLVLTTVRPGETPWQRHLCGGEQSEFEKHDLRFLEHDPQSEQRLGALVVRWEAGDGAAYAGFLDTLLAEQRLLAFVLIVRPAGEPGPDLRFFGDTWSLDRIDALPGAATVDVYYNRNWQADIGKATDLRYTHPTAPAGDKGGAASLTLPMVSIEHFGGAAVLESTPPETLAGPEIAIYELDGKGMVTTRKGRLDAIHTQERTVYALDDVNVSHTGVVWRDDRVLAESFRFQGHDNGCITGTNVTVSEPTRALKGTYFLAPTGNTHHSHLMWETLRRLDAAERLGTEAGILASSVLSPSQREYFPLFGYPPERVVFRHPKDTVRVERLIVSTDLPQRYDRGSVDYLRRIGAAYYERPSRRPTRLYLTRRDSRICRNMVNADEIEALFESCGFTTIVASDLSARDKITLFSTAEIVAGPLGAAFTYLPFALNATAIALTAEAYFPPVHLETAGVQRCPMVCVRGVGLLAYTDAWGYEHTSFYMPPELVRVVLDRHLNRK